jgi:hypothetical protein
MQESLDSLSTTQGGNNVEAESTRRKDTNPDLAWLGAMIEGEGCIFAGFRNLKTDNNLTVRITVYNTHPLIIRRTTEILCSLGVQFYISAPHAPKISKPGVTVVVGGKGRVKKLLILLLPYLYAKRKRAQIALELIEYREQLALKYSGNRNTKWNGVSFQGDPTIKKLIEDLRNEVHNYPSVLDFSRQANRPFGESSETLRLPQL